MFECDPCRRPGPVRQDGAGHCGPGPVGRVRGDRGDRLTGREHGLDDDSLVGDDGTGQRREGAQSGPGGGASGRVPAHAVHHDERRRQGEIAVLVDTAQPPDIGGRPDDGDQGVALRPGRGRDLAHEHLLDAGAAAGARSRPTVEWRRRYLHGRDSAHLR